MNLSPFFLSRLVMDDIADCWLWVGSRTYNGYGIVRRDGRKVRAHRCAYESMVGPIPSGMDLDHLCRNRSCVNPQHLEPVSRRTNVIRGLCGVASLNPDRPYVGVRRTGSGWAAQLRTGQRHNHLGTFGTADEAARAYDAAVRSLHGPNADTNESLGLLVN